MKGHLRRRGPRSWAVVIYLGRDAETGKKRYKWHSVKGTKKDAERAMTDILHRLQTQQYAEPSRLTVGEYMTEWLEHMSTRVRLKTWEGYEVMSRRHIVPGLGRLPLASLTPVHVQRWCERQLREGRADGRGESLSPRTVEYAHAVLNRALKHAVRLGLVARNVAAAAQPPRPEKGRAPNLGPEVASGLLEAARGHRLYLPILLAVSTGMRLGEVLGLRWEDVDFASKRLSVAQTLQATSRAPCYRFVVPKTEQSRRQIALPETLIAALRAHRRKQAEYKLSLGAEHVDHGLVCCKETGHPWPPKSVSRAFVKLARRAGLELRFHDLRHLHATALLRKGVHPKVVSDRLGHSAVRITLDTYSHVMPDIQDEAAKAVDEILEGTLAE